MSLNPLDIKELRDIVDWANLTPDVRQLSIKHGDVELFLSRDRQSSNDRSASPQAVTPAPETTSTPAPAPVPSATPVAGRVVTEPGSGDELGANEVLIKAPMVGVFYASPKPGEPAFVKVGDTVSASTVLGIVEVMKLMNNIEARVEGTVTKILVNNEQAVEYGQPLMVITRDA
ncbi:acetyl-CoA carboxylase biotin carboxyl carrier protein [Paenarthrobacter nitroguajacolicus]|uniref:acetyl-CoA carboxylase biotin carboxyl carrier protein n=1 Tax=Paenarthrobacter nitroguajacolicus TaxID=211146 RepID=UPI0015BB1136|nr:acetyl-CoA carboxylase biotin carboxyl carrier protein [Paenarthrobacter nitroguajacolicus]NWL10311.1 acetyl-CoA carboxylase biotin carboxyl carrier protein [Paenarthrobacter nitroguajacolicus]